MVPKMFENIYHILNTVFICSFFQIHRMYRSTGASLAKAQAEFTSGVMQNEHVRQAAAEAARETVRSQFAGNNQAGTGTGNRY